MKQAAKITFTQSKRKTQNNDMPTREKKKGGKSNTLAQGKSRVLPTDRISWRKRVIAAHK